MLTFAIDEYILEGTWINSIAEKVHRQFIRLPNIDVGFHLAAGINQHGTLRIVTVHKEKSNIRSGRALHHSQNPLTLPYSFYGGIMCCKLYEMLQMAAIQLMLSIDLLMRQFYEQPDVDEQQQAHRAAKALRSGRHIKASTLVDIFNG